MRMKKIDAAKIAREIIGSKQTENEKTIAAYRAAALPGDRSRERVIDPGYIRDAVNRAETLLHGLSKKEKTGAVVVYRCGGGPVPKAYKYSFMADVIGLLHDGKTWIITGVTRENVKGESNVSFILSTDQRAAMVREMIKQAEN